MDYFDMACRDARELDFSIKAQHLGMEPELAKDVIVAIRVETKKCVYCGNPLENVKPIDTFEGLCHPGCYVDYCDNELHQTKHPDEKF